MNALISRFALAGFVVVLAAAVVATTGSGGIGGSLGSLFGYHTQLKPPPQPVALSSSAADVNSIDNAILGAVAKPRQAAPHGRTRSVPRHRPATAPAPVAQAPVPAQSPAPAPSPVPSAPKPPPPAQGNVQHAAQTVQQVTAPVAPAAGPADQVVQTVNQTCAVIGGCP